VIRSWWNYIFIFVTTGEKSPHQQQQTNNIVMSSCTFEKLLFTLRSWMFFNNIGNHSSSSTIRLWLPMSMMSFHIFVLTQRQILMFIHSYCHHLGGSFMVELQFYFCHFWGKKPTPTTTNQHHEDVFLYIMKSTFYIYKIDVYFLHI
jgi:hypothetical protein